MNTVSRMEQMQLPIDPASIQEADTLHIDSSGTTPCPSQLGPDVYLNDARLDLGEESGRGNRNAVHNAKRKAPLKLPVIQVERKQAVEAR